MNKTACAVLFSGVLLIVSGDGSREILRARPLYVDLYRQIAQRANFAYLGAAMPGLALIEQLKRTKQHKLA
jgi:hypothetical protein